MSRAIAIVLSLSYVSEIQKIHSDKEGNLACCFVCCRLQHFHFFPTMVNQELEPDMEVADGFTISASRSNDEVRLKFEEWLAGLESDRKML